MKKKRKLTIKLIIYCPNGSAINVTMNSGEANNYYFKTNNIFSNYGDYSYYIWAIDSNGNQTNTNNYDFSMPPNWDIDGNGVCNIVDLTLVSNHFNEEGVNGWIREDVDNNGIIQVLDLIEISSHYSETW